MGWRPHVVSVSSSALLVLLQLLVLLMLPADASSSSQLFLERTQTTTTTIYVVYMGEKKHDDPSLVVASHHATLASVLGSKDEALSSIVYSYKHGFSGFAAKLTQPQAEELKKYPGVVSVKPNTYHHVHTTRSWDFLGMSYGQQQSSSWSSSSRLLRKAKYGEDVIVGVIDSGIWPESRSFDDSGYGYGPVPKRWKGVCQTGQAFNASNCNRKVIGARWYAADVSEEDLKNEYRSPRDANGHGTHTASTIAGSPVRNASHHGGGLAAGIARGGAPRARLAIYKACHAVGGSASCGDASILAALDAAIGDGVDLVSLSLGGLGEIYQSLHAVAAGITVVLAAGNDGPVEQSLNNALPWGITVAAATMDRTFPTVVTLGDGEKLVNNGPNPSSCIVSCDEKNLGSENITGKIVICRAPVFWSDYPPPRQLSRASRAAIAGGAKGIIFEQYSTNSLDTQVVCQGHLPCVVVDRESIFTIQSSDSNVAKISPAATMVGSQVASPRIATFSSRGPSAEFPSVLKRKPADAFDMGGGLIAPDRAMDPGLVYDIQPEEYTRLDDRADRLNLPSIAVSDLKNSVTVSRTVTNVGPAEVATYRAVVEAPAGVTMDVEPPVIAFERGGARNATFRVTFVAKQRVQGGYAFGSLTWLDDAKRHSVRIPVAVRTVVRDLVADVA
ncbi:Subtilisin-like serine endopeptidase family protein [Zea mays]|uniref:Subtilisin-like serine endopeptidase family protein n=1 Tax=Zea mays TaxID=4577 RepID=A0A1D6F708_MAIZE|nr:Subtilisin-like serine endopeptidase family protein [Zea mays]